MSSEPEVLDERTLDSFESSYKKVRKLYDLQSLGQKVDLLEARLNKKLKYIRHCSYDSQYFKNNIENPIGTIQIPLGLCGPISVSGKNAVGEFFVPMATTEGALVLTYDLGMRLLKLGDPVKAELVSKIMHLDPIFPIKNFEEAKTIETFVKANYGQIKSIAESKSSHTKLLGIEMQRIENNFVMKCLYDTGDAHGLNMINEATFNLCTYVSSNTGFKFYHRSHFSGVKHHSLMNEKEGYGKKVKASAVITKKALRMLSVTADQMKDFTDRCIQCGSAAEISSINVHASNGIAAIYLATGQDMADISSAHVCKAACWPINNGQDLYYEVTIPNLLIATVGGGTGLGTQRECLEIMDCYGSNRADKFAEIIAAAVLAGEFPTAAAVINGSYVDIHNKYGRNKNKHVT